MRKTTSAIGNAVVTFDASDFPLFQKLGGVRINTIIMGHVTAAQNVVVKITNDAGIVAEVSSIGGPMWLKDLRFIVHFADITDTLTLTASGETGVCTLTVEAGGVTGG